MFDLLTSNFKIASLVKSSSQANTPEDNSGEGEKPVERRESDKTSERDSEHLNDSYEENSDKEPEEELNICVVSEDT